MPHTPPREPFPSLIVYRVSKWSAVKPIFHGFFQGKVYGSKNVPPTGPVVIVSNHGSYLDPPFVAIAMNRPVAYMAKQELFEHPLSKKIMELYGAYPVKRGSSDRAALQAAIRSLQSGWAAGVFLEGTRTPDGRIYDPKLGAALIAAKTQAPLLPVAIWGTPKALGSKFPYFRRTPVAIRIGSPIPPPTATNREELLTVTHKCASIIDTLLDQGY